MSLNVLIPNIFYSDIKTGLAFFVDALAFTIVYSAPEPEAPFYIIKRDNLKLYLLENHEFAIKDRPQLRIETDDIQSVYDEIANRAPGYLHPNSRSVSLKPWGAREFAVKDGSDVCVIFMQWGD